MSDLNSGPRPFGALTAFARRAILAAAMGAAVVVLAIGLWFLRNVLLVAFAGVLLAILLRAPADWLASRTRLNEKWAMALVFVALVVVIALLIVAFAGQVVAQAQQFAEQLPRSMEEFGLWLAQFPLAERILVPLPALDNGELFWQAAGMAYTVVQVAFGVLVLLFVTIYLAWEPKLYATGLLRLVPIGERPVLGEVLGATEYTLRRWLSGTLLRMLSVGVMTFVGLWLLGMPLALLLAVLAFLLDFVPYFGPIAASIPAILLAFVEGPQQALYVVVLYVVVQQIESLVIAPLVYKRTVYLPPVVTILSQIILFAIAGTLGILLATPLAAVTLVWIKLLYVERVLGDEVDVPGRELARQQLPIEELSERSNAD